MADEKRVIEIVVKATGDADLKRLASEMQGMRKDTLAARKEMEQSNKTLAGMRKEAQATRRELAQTNQTLGGFGSTFGKLAKAFGAGFAITKLVQSSDVIKDLSKNVQDLTGEFLDATLQASGFTDELDAEFWMTAQQGARDLGRAIGDFFTKMKAWGEDSSIVKAWQYMQPGAWIAKGVQGAWRNYAENVEFDMMPIDQGAFVEQMGDLSRELSKERESRIGDATEKVLKDFGIALRNQREYEDRQTTEGRELAAFNKWLEAARKSNRAQLEGSGLEDRLRSFSYDFDQSFKPVEIDIEGVADDMMRMTEEGRRFQENWDRIARTTLTWEEGLGNAIDYMQELNELQGDLTNQALVWGDTLTSAFKGVLTEELHNTRDLLRSITHDMRDFYAELAARAAAEQTLEWVRLGLTALKGGLGSLGSTGGDWTSQAVAAGVSAKGNAFDRGHVVPMAKGAIVTGPTLFPMARGMGLMGEAGPEAVMPLKRGRDGKLGVAAGRSNIVIENHGQPMTANVISSEDETRIVLRAATMGAEIAQSQMNRSVVSGYGPTAQSFQRAYGLRRRV